MKGRISMLRGWRWRSAMGAAVVIVSSVAWAATRFTHQDPTLPTAEVKRGEFVDHLQIRGEVKPLVSRQVNAPTGAGGDVQIVKLVKNGQMVKAGELIVQFDASNLQITLNENQSTLKQTEVQITQTRAQNRLTEEQDKTDLLSAQFDVERAKLEVSKQEILSQIDGEEAKAKLADSEQSLNQAEQKLKSDKQSDDANVRDQISKRDKAQFEVDKVRGQIAGLTVNAPGAGMVTLMTNSRAGGFFTDNAPEFKEGDKAWPGAPIAELPDFSSLRISSHIDEIDRGQLKDGQTATVRVDAVPDMEFPARVQDISTLAKMDFSNGWPPKKNFDLTLQMEKIDPRLRPGMSATIRVAVESIPNSILIPVKAAFSKEGRTVAYVFHGGKFEERTIEVSQRSSEEAVVTRGLASGERVALQDPTLVAGKS